MSLPAAWIDKIFAKMLIRYGADWTRMWNGLDDKAMQLVKADWAQELGIFAERPEFIAHGLDNLPSDRPPTVGQFRDLCKNRPAPQPVALPAPPRDPARVAALVAQALAAKPAPPDEKVSVHLEWARRLRKRDFLGERLTIHQRQAWREALKNEPEQPTA